MFQLEKAVKKNILNLKPYTSARDEFEGNEGIFLDANENPFGTLNRYPDPYQKELKSKISQFKNIETKNIFISNGSDEVFDLLFKVFCEPQKDKILVFEPSFTMYQVIASLYNVEVIFSKLNADFQIDKSKIEPHIKDSNLKIIFICNPNNPTGNCFEYDTIDYIIQNFDGIVVVDEAYHDFCSRPSYIEKINQYPNLIVCQTMSKSWGLANARIGITFTQSPIVQLLNKVKLPYNVSGLNQNAALLALQNIEYYQNNKKIILEEKQKLEAELQKLTIVKKIYSSDSNFLFVAFENGQYVYEELIKNKIITRNRNQVVKDCIRITIGSSAENEILISSLKKIKK